MIKQISLVVSLPLLARCVAGEVGQRAASSPVAPLPHPATEGIVATPAASSASTAVPSQSQALTAASAAADSAKAAAVKATEAATSAVNAAHAAAAAAAVAAAAGPPQVGGANATTEAATSAVNAANAAAGAAAVAAVAGPPQVGAAPSSAVAPPAAAAQVIAQQVGGANPGSFRGSVAGGQPSSSSQAAGSVPRFSTLLAGLTFAAVVKTSCMASNVMVQLSPFPQVQRWSSRGCTGEADAAPYVSIFFGGWQWCYYGMFAYLLTKRSGFLILVHSNFLGAILGSYYISTFFRNCQYKQAQGSLNTYLTAVASLVLLQASALAVLPSERALFLSGLVASFCSFLGALSMLVTVPAVLSSSNSRSIPGPLVTANFFSAMVWCLCGWMLADPMVLAPNVAAMASSAVCIYLKQRYPSDEDGDGKDQEQDRPANAACGAKLATKIPSEYTAFAKDLSPSTLGSCSPSGRGKSPLASNADDGDMGETGGTC